MRRCSAASLPGAPWLTEAATVHEISADVDLDESAHGVAPVHGMISTLYKGVRSNSPSWHLREEGQLQPVMRCAECAREVEGFSAIAEKRGYCSDSVGELVPFCPECAKREFERDGPHVRHLRPN